MTTALTRKETPAWNEEQVALVKRTVAKDATNDELQMFMHLSGKYNLDPFAKEIWFLKLGGIPTITTSRDGYLKIANEHPQFDGLASDVVYEKDAFEKTPNGVKHTYGVGNRGAILGAYALIYRKDRRFPIYVFAPFKDYVKPSNTWKTYPHAMILKVAEAMALKRAFSLSGLVTVEEIGTPDGEKDVVTVEVSTTPQATQPAPAKSLREEPGFDAPTKEQWASVRKYRLELGMDPEALTKFAQERLGVDIKQATGGQVDELIGLLKEELEKKVE